MNFWIVRKENEKIYAQGQVCYTMISAKNGRPTWVPDDIIAQYQV